MRNICFYFMFVAIAYSGLAAAQSAGWPSSLQGILSGSEEQIRVAPCMGLKRSTNYTILNNPTQCTANPLYLVAKVYEHLAKPGVNVDPPRAYVTGPITQTQTKMFPDWPNPNNAIVPKNFTMTLTRKALFRLAQKQHYCSKHARSECIADTKTPCSWIDDDRLAYQMGLAAGNTAKMAQCVYFTQSTFTRLLHWEMFQIERDQTPGTLAEALTCFWPPHKRETVACSSDEVGPYCAKMPGCTALMDNFRFSCQANAAVANWKNFTSYSGDPFNATQHLYRSAMARMLSASSYEDIAGNKEWGNDSTTRFIYMFSGVNSLFQELYMSVPGLTGGVMSDNDTCSNFATEEACLAADSGANHYYCSWSRDQLVPGFSDANNPDFPTKRCQASTLARLELASILRDNKRYGESDLSAQFPPNMLMSEKDDFMVGLFKSLYFNEMSNTTGICGDMNFCHVKANITLPFPAWKPADTKRNSAATCQDAMSEKWVAE